MQRTAPYLLSLLLLSAGVAQAANRNNLFFRKSEPQQEEQTSCNICAYDCCCQERCIDRSCMNGFFLSGEYLYWQVCQDGLDIAGSGSSYPGNIKHVDFNWTSGFRAGLGGQWCDDWAFEAAYTYMRPKGSVTVSDDQVHPIWIPEFSAESFCTRITDEMGERRRSVAVTIAEFTKAKSKVKFDYNLIDVELRRNIACSPCFHFEAIGGLQGGILEQRNSAKFAGNFFYQSEDDLGSSNVVDPEQAIAPIEIESSQKWKFSGGGIRVGGAGEYRSCSGFLLFGASRYNLLYGNSKLRYSGEVSEFGEITLSTPFEFPELVDLTVLLFEQYYDISGREKFCNFVSNVNSRIGFGFENTCGCVYFRLEAAWEITYWQNLCQYRKGLSQKGVFIENEAQGAPSTKESCIVHTDITNTTKVARDVTLHGLTFSVQVTF